MLVPPDLGDRSAAAFARALEGFGAWRSVEVFGPPGAGKSHLSRQVSAALGVLTMCDRQAVRFYAAEDFPRTTALAESVLERRRLRNYYGLRLGGFLRGYWRHAGPEQQRYRAAVEALRAALPLSPVVRARFDNRVLGSGALISRALDDGRQIIADEGLLNQLNSTIARTVGDRLDNRLRDLTRACLESYPWQKKALIVEASPETCERRQEDRGHRLFTPDRPQTIFHAVTNQLDALLRKSGWQVERIAND
jgi:hypothetical protein